MSTVLGLSILVLTIVGQALAPQQPSTTPPAETRPKVKHLPEGRNSADEGSGQGDVVRINTNLVTVPVSVMDRSGKYIVGLRQEDFEIYEDGVKQDLSNFESIEKPFTVALLLDISDSVGFRIGDIQAAAIAFVDQLRQDDRVMVVSFDSQVRILSEPTTNHELVREAIRQTQMGGGTRVYDAVDFVLNQRLKQIRGRKAAILFTDGIDTGSFQANFKDNERDAEESDVLIYAIQYSTSKDVADQLRAGLNSPSGGSVSQSGSGANRVDTARAESYLRVLSEKTSGRLYRADDTQNLTRSFARIAGELRQQYTLGYYPRTTSGPGQRRQIKVRVSGPQLVVRARNSYVSGPSVRNQKKP